MGTLPVELLQKVLLNMDYETLLNISKDENISYLLDDYFWRVKLDYEYGDIRFYDDDRRDYALKKSFFTNPQYDELYKALVYHRDHPEIFHIDRVNYVPTIGFISEYGTYRDIIDKLYLPGYDVPDEIRNYVYHILVNDYIRKTKDYVGIGNVTNSIKDLDSWIDYLSIHDNDLIIYTIPTILSTLNVYLDPYYFGGSDLTNQLRHARETLEVLYRIPQYEEYEADQYDSMIDANLARRDRDIHNDIAYFLDMFLKAAMTGNIKYDPEDLEKIIVLALNLRSVGEDPLFNHANRIKIASYLSRHHPASFYRDMALNTLFI